MSWTGPDLVDSIACILPPVNKMRGERDERREMRGEERNEEKHTKRV